MDDHTDESVRCTDGNSSVPHGARGTYERELLPRALGQPRGKSAFIGQHGSYESLERAYGIGDEFICPLMHSSLLK